MVLMDRRAIRDALRSASPDGQSTGGHDMKHKLGMLLATTAFIAVPAAAQDAAGVLQAADRAIGASGVNSGLYTGTGTMRYVGQNYDSHDDWAKARRTPHTRRPSITRASPRRRPTRSPFPRRTPAAAPCRSRSRRTS